MEDLNDSLFVTCKPHQFSSCLTCPVYYQASSSLGYDYAPTYVHTFLFCFEVVLVASTTPVDEASAGGTVRVEVVVSEHCHTHASFRGQRAVISCKRMRSKLSGAS